MGRISPTCSAVRLLWTTFGLAEELSGKGDDSLMENLPELENGTLGGTRAAPSAEIECDLRKDRLDGPGPSYGENI